MREMEAGTMGEEESKARERCSRLSILGETLWRPFVAWVDGVLLLLHYGDLIAKVFPDSKEFLEKAAFLSGLPWYWKVITLLVVNMLLMWEGAFRAVRKRENQRDALTAQVARLTAPVSDEEESSIVARHGIPGVVAVRAFLRYRAARAAALKEAENGK
jgi:hypothetical protein